MRFQVLKTSEDPTLSHCRQGQLFPSASRDFGSVCGFRITRRSMARESWIVNQHLSGWQARSKILGRASVEWYLWVGWYIPTRSQPLVFIQKAVLAGTVSPEMKYSALNIAGTEPQCLEKCRKYSGLSGGIAWRITPLPSLFLSNVVFLKCFKSGILFRIFSPCTTPSSPLLRLFEFKRGASVFRRVSMDTQSLLFKQSNFPFFAVHGRHSGPGKALPGAMLRMDTGMPVLIH